MTNPFRIIKNNVEPLETLDNAIDRIADTAFYERPPTTIYHYTDWVAAGGIISTNEFWASAHDCTNDPAELLTSDAVIDAAIERMQQDGTCTALADLFNQGKERLHAKRMTPPYLVCFSSEPDKASQWEQYAAAGTGVCLGIEFLPHERLPDDDFGRGFGRVRYSADDVMEIVDSAFRQICSEVMLVGRQGAMDIRLIAEVALLGMHRVAAKAAILTKDSKWSSECEWRLYALVKPSSTPTVFTRGTEDRSIRYVKLLLRETSKPLALREILIGPDQDCAAARQRLAELLQNSGYPEAEDGGPQIHCSRGGS